MKLCVSRISTSLKCMSWSILNLLTHCEYSEIKYYWNDLTCNRTLFWFLRHSGTLRNRILVIFTIFLRRKIGCPSWNWVRNWLRMQVISKPSNEWNESIDLKMLKLPIIFIKGNKSQKNICWLPRLVCSTILIWECKNKIEVNLCLLSSYEQIIILRPNIVKTECFLRA